MLLFDVLSHFFYYRWFKYLGFSGFSDESHLKISCQLLESKYHSSKGVIREINIIGLKSEGVCIKSTAYALKLFSDFPELFKDSFQVNFLLEEMEVPQNQNSVFNWCQMFFATFENPQFTWIKSKCRDILANKLSDVEISSIHIKILKTRYDYHTNKIDENTYEKIILLQMKNQNIKDLMLVNSFVPGKGSTSHELGYLLNFLLDIYNDTQSPKLLECIHNLLEKMHTIFVQHKVFYSGVVRRGNSINVSGILLISQAFLKHTLLFKDFRYANSAYYLIDVAKFLQRKNLKNYISNTLPIYRYGSPYKYPAWTLCYFINALSLKDKTNKTLKDEIGFHI